MRTLIAVLVLTLFVPAAFANGPKASSGTPHVVNTARHDGDHKGKGHDKDKHPPVIVQGGGGGVNGPLGKTCAEARERMRWSNLPCSPDMPE